MNTVRFGLIGPGNIGQRHADCLLAGRITGAEMTAVCSRSQSRLEKYQTLRTFTDAGELLGSGLVDAVIIATPHYQHSTLGIAALERGLHVLVEKPIAAHKADAERLIAAHRSHPQLVFAGMFQLRAEPRYLKIRELVQSGGLGEIVRASWIVTDWFRTEAYYASTSWRATWQGEGGGVLLNQCLHNLDMLQWLLGMPARVRGFCQLGRFHDIEVEDSVTAYLEYANGATGVFVSSTGEAPGSNRFEIAGTRGRLLLENDRLVLSRNDQDMLAFSKSSPLGFGRPAVSTEEIPVANATESHAILLQNFVNAILDQAPLIAPGAEGLHSVELANAILYSSLLGRMVELPLDGLAYEKKIHELIAGSKRKPKQTCAPASPEDFAASFRR